MAVAFWHSRSTFDRCEICFASLATASSALTAALPLERKQLPATATCIFAILLALSKWRSKRIEESDKSAKVKREQDQQVTWSKAFEALKIENESGKQRALDEIAVIREKFDNQLRTAIRAILEDFHERYFRGESDEEKHKHRTTLFTCVESEGDPTREKRLAIYVRIGVHPNSRCSWPVDDNDLGRCRGVAGKIWFHGSGNVTSADCDWPSDESDLVQQAAYAKSLAITVDEAKALNVKSKVFTGARIMARGQKWGVILLDSLKDSHIVDKAGKRQLLAQCSNLISSIVSRMEL